MIADFINENPTETFGLVLIAFSIIAFRWEHRLYGPLWRIPHRTKRSRRA